MKRVSKGSKMCWEAKQYKKGWRLGLCIGNKVSYLDYWFKTVEELDDVCKKRIVVIEMKGGK